jgi:hypothetical protein
MEQTTYMPHSGNDFQADILLPCPFCGYIPELTFAGNEHSPSRKVYIKCTNKQCRVEIHSATIRYDSKQVALWAIAIWNNRVKEPI